MHCVRIPVHCQPRRRVSPNQQSTGVRADGETYLLTTKLTGARNSVSFVPFSALTLLVGQLVNHQACKNS